MFSAFNTFGRMGAPAGRTIAQQIAAMSTSLWLEPSVTNGYQDSAGTTALTQPGGGSADPPVGKALDLSGLGNHALQATSTARPKLSARVNLLVGTATLATQSVTVTAAAHTIDWSGAGTITASGAHSGALSKGQTFTPSAGTLTLTVSGSVTSASLVLGSSVGTYQAVTDANTYDSAGFPLYWKFDGTDDFLDAVGAIGCGTVVVAAYVDPAAPDLFGLLTNSADQGAGVDYVFEAVAPPITWSAEQPAAGGALASASGNIWKNSVKTGVIGTGTVAVYSIDGTDHPGPYEMPNAARIGRRRNYSGYFVGNVYAVICFPTILTAAQRALVEKYVAQKAGVTL